MLFSLIFYVAVQSSKSSNNISCFPAQSYKTKAFITLSNNKNIVVVVLLLLRVILRQRGDFHMGEEPDIEKPNVQARVPERNSHVFNLSNCSVTF